MLFNRYAAPFLFIDTLIKGQNLYIGVTTILKENNEKKLWDMYCATLSNPLNEVTSFTDYKNKLIGNTDNREQTTKELKTKQIEQIIKKSDSILTRFIPPQKK